MLVASVKARFEETYNHLSNQVQSEMFMTFSNCQEGGLLGGSNHVYDIREPKCGATGICVKDGA